MMTDEERAKRTADAIAYLLNGGKPVPAPMKPLTEHQAEERRRMVQAQKLK